MLQIDCWFPKLRDHLAPVGNQDSLSLFHRPQVFTQPVLQLSDTNGSHKLNVATRSYIDKALRSAERGDQILARDEADGAPGPTDARGPPSRYVIGWSVFPPIRPLDGVCSLTASTASLGTVNGGRATVRIPRSVVASFALLCVITAVLMLPVLAPVQIPQHQVMPGRDSMTIVAGERYRAGPVRRFFGGYHYRYLWTEPITVEILDLRRFAGGLRPVGEGGGMETRALHFVSDSARAFVFRSLDKEVTGLMRRGLSRSLLAWAVQDQISSSHPAAPLVAAPLQAAVGLPAGNPRLVVLPRDSALAQFQGRFGGLLGIIQERPDNYPGVRGMTIEPPVIKESLEVLALLDSTTNHRVDSSAYLTARLLDLFLNDWDRHSEQWRWVGRPQGAGILWQPIPVDRDHAFAWYDGVLMSVTRIALPKFSNFSPAYPPLRALTRNSRRLDRRLLPGVDRATWDSIASFVVTRLTDSVIDAAVSRMPEPYWRLSGPRLAAALKQRRDRLPGIGMEFFESLQRQRRL